MRVELVLHDADVAVTPDGTLERAWVAIDGGRIAAVGAGGTAPPDAASARSLTGLALLPGVVDPHTHPGNLGMFRDELGSESRSAARGGVTTMIGAVKSSRLGGPFLPRVRTEDLGSYLTVFEEARTVVNREAWADVALTFMILNDRQASEIPRYSSELGVTSFKFFPSAAAPTPWHEAIGLPTAGDDGTLYLALRHIAALGGLASFHPENGQVSRILDPEVRASGEESLAAWERRSPPFLEAYDIVKMAFLARWTGARIYAVHLNSRAGLTALGRARTDGVAIIGETCPRYLVLAMEEPPDPPAFGKMAPPVRTAEDRAALWAAIADGTLDCVGSDHSPMSRGMKQADAGIWGARAGAGDIGTLLPIMLSEGVGRGRISLQRLVEVCSANPARAFGLYPRKGAIAVGSDADLVAVDLSRRKPVRAAELESICDWSPYEGMELTGWPVLSLLRGSPVLEGDGVTGSPRGRYLARS